MHRVQTYKSEIFSEESCFAAKKKGMDAASELDRYMDIYCTCKIQWYTVAMSLLILLDIVFIVTTKVRKLMLFEEHLFSNVTKVMLFISDAQSYVPLRMCKVVGSIHLFKLMGKLTPDCVTVKRNWIWDVLELDWKEVSITLHGNNINMPTSVINSGLEDFLVKSPCSCMQCIKQGRKWFSLKNNNREPE